MLMKPFLLLNCFVLFIFLGTRSYAQQFITQGEAVLVDPITYRITPSLGGKTGMITNLYPVNLAQNFTINFKINLGVNDPGGADGLAFILSNVCSPTLVSGQGLGASGIPNSIIIEFDTYTNGPTMNDIDSDHTGIYADGQLNAGGNIMDGGGGQPVCLRSSCANMEDGAWHDVRITWEYLSATSQRISITFDGELRATSTRNHIAQRFNNNTNVFWSVSGSTGAASNLQQFRVVDNNNNNFAVCSGSNVTLNAPTLGSNYSWTGGSPSTTNTATFTFTSNSTISCSYRDYCGINRTVNFTITANANPVVSVQDINVCELNPPPLKATPAVPGTYNYVWTVPAGATNPGNVASFTTLVAGAYTVVITNPTTGCSSAPATGNVITAPAIDPVFSTIPDTICRGTVLGPLPLTSDNGITGTWSPAVNNQTTTTYTFTPAGNVCAYTKRVTIVVNNTPVADLSAFNKICRGEVITLDPKATGYDLTYLWQDGSTGPVFDATTPGTYTVTVSNSCGSTTVSATLAQSVCNIFIPTAFTPNSDGLNDFFRVMGASYIRTFSMDIYNRWGQQLFSNTNPFVGWDGTFKGRQQDAGMYVYYIRYTNLIGEASVLKGTFTLLR